MTPISLGPHRRLPPQLCSPAFVPASACLQIHTLLYALRLFCCGAFSWQCPTTEGQDFFAVGLSAGNAP